MLILCRHLDKLKYKFEQEKKNPPVDLKIIEVPGPSTSKEEKQTENCTFLTH